VVFKQYIKKKFWHKIYKSCDSFVYIYATIVYLWKAKWHKAQDLAATHTSDRTFMVCILLCVIYKQIKFRRVAQQIMKKKQNRHYCVNICFYSLFRYMFWPFSWVILRHTWILFSFWTASLINMNSYCVCVIILYWQLYLNFKAFNRKVKNKHKLCLEERSQQNITTTVEQQTTHIQYVAGTGLKMEFVILAINTLLAIFVILFLIFSH
jgi:hypothetical protein